MRNRSLRRAKAAPRDVRDVGLREVGLCEVGPLQVAFCGTRRIRRLAIALCASLGLLGIGWSEEVPKSGSDDQQIAKRLLTFNSDEAAGYKFYREADRKEKLEFRKEPVYVWTNAVRSGGQNGAVFVWTHRGRPEVVASFHTNPTGQTNPSGQAGSRAVVHELHSLSQKKLTVERLGSERWEPRAGIALEPLPEAPPPADSARRRMFQMRDLLRDFAAHNIDRERQTWQLRLLTQPLYRYESTDPAVIDGALFAFVTSAGTDPEIIIVIEARQTDQGPQWQYAVCRFSDLDLFVQHKKREVWTSVVGNENVLNYDPRHLYRLIFDRTVDDFVAGRPASK